MAVNRIDVEIGNFDLTVKTLVLTATPSTTDDKQCQVYAELGDGVNNLDGSGGIFELTLKIGNQNVQPAPQPYQFGTSPRASIKTNTIVIPANQEVKAYIRSPNAADTNIAVKAYLFEIILLDSVELTIDPDDLRNALSGITIPNRRVVLGPCRSAETIGITRLGSCGTVKITRQ